MASRSRIRLFARMIVYITVVVVLYLNRGGISWRNLTTQFGGGAGNDTTLVVVGRDLAPFLVDRLVAHYQHDYPDLAISVKGDGTNQALEDLLNEEASAAFLFRLPSVQENELFQTIDGDPAIVEPVALGAVVLLAGADTDTDPVDLDDFRGLLSGDLAERCDRFYVPDPNEGLWDSVRQSQGLTDPLSGVNPEIIYLADAAAVTEAVSNDSRAWGMVSSLNVPQGFAENLASGVQVMSVQGAGENPPALPTYENVATGAYPLHHRLYVACRENGDRQGGMFLTHLASARGLRQIERAGVVPARYVLREVYLTTKPVGE